MNRIPDPGEDLRFDALCYEAMLIWCTMGGRAAIWHVYATLTKRRAVSDVVDEDGSPVTEGKP